MNKWQPTLRSKIRGEDYFDIAGNLEKSSRWHNEYRFISRYVNETNQAPGEKKIWMLTTCGDDVLIGFSDRVHNILGEHHPQSIDRRHGDTSGGRNKPFFLGYHAPIGTRIPNHSELNQILESDTIKDDLERLFEEAEKNHPNYKKSQIFETELPKGNILGDNEWDKAIKHISSDNKLDKIVTSQNGKISTIPIEVESQRAAPQTEFATNDPINSYNEVKNNQDTIEDKLKKKSQLQRLEKKPKWGLVITGLSIILSGIFVAVFFKKNQKKQTEKEKKWTERITDDPATEINLN